METVTIDIYGTIRLGQFIKLAGFVEDGAWAREVIHDGDVTVNGVVDTRRGHQLSDGDRVSLHTPQGTLTAIVQRFAP